MNDTDLMPFGIHKHKQMKDVPAQYFHWFWHTCKPFTNDNARAVGAYIEKSWNALKQETKDTLIWTK